MKKLIRLAAIVLSTALFSACSLDNDPMADGNHRLNQSAPATAKVYTYKLSLGGDYVEQSEEPLTRNNSDNPYVGINVTRKDKNTLNADSEKYAHGLFLSKSNISIDLISGYTYEFEATVLTDGTDRYYFTNRSYPEPFAVKEGSSTDQPGYPTDSINKFVYTFDKNYFPSENSKKYLCALSSGTAFVDIEDPKYAETGECSYPRVHRYYGSISNVDPTSLVSDEINIDVSYKCFGIYIDASQVPPGTYVTMQDVTGENNRPIKDELAYLQTPSSLKLGKDSDYSSTWEDIYSLNNLSGDGTDNFTFRFTWHNGSNIETFEETFQVRAKYKKRLKLVINGEAITTTKGNIIITEDGDALSDEDLVTITYPAD